MTRNESVIRKTPVTYLLNIGCKYRSEIRIRSSFVQGSCPDGILILAGCRGRRFLEVEVQLCLLPDVPRPGEWNVLLRMLFGDPAVEHFEDREPAAVGTLNRRLHPFSGRGRHGALSRRPHHAIALRRGAVSFSRKLIAIRIKRRNPFGQSCATGWP